MTVVFHPSPLSALELFLIVPYYLVRVTFAVAQLSATVEHVQPDPNMLFTQPRTVTVRKEEKKKGRSAGPPGATAVEADHEQN